MAKPIPDGFHTLSAHIVVDDGVKAIELYKKAFGATEVTRMMTPDGKSVMHAHLTIGESPLMLASEFPPHTLSPKTRGGTSVILHVYVENVDAAYDRAVKAGLKAKMPPTDMFWGDRYGQVEDEFGHLWSIATHTHDYTPAQIAENAKQYFANAPKGC